MQRQQFGVRAPGRQYHDRPGVYALAFDDDRALVIATPAGFFLPGGGVDPGEDPLAALARELREEAGLRAGAFHEIGSAGQYIVDAATDIGYNKLETFYLATGLVAVAVPAEPDHQPRWEPIERALAGLREEAQRWALRQALTLPNRRA